MKRLLPAKCKKGHILGDEKIQGVLTGVSRYVYRAPFFPTTYSS